MTIEVEISPEAEAKLAAEADLRGMPVATYAGSLLQEALALYRMGAATLTLENLDAFSESLSEGSENMPVLSLEANERASYYEDRW